MKKIYIADPDLFEKNSIEIGKKVYGYMQPLKPYIQQFNKEQKRLEDVLKRVSEQC